MPKLDVAALSCAVPCPVPRALLYYGGHGVNEFYYAPFLWICSTRVGTYIPPYDSPVIKNSFSFKAGNCAMLRHRGIALQQETNASGVNGTPWCSANDVMQGSPQLREPDTHTRTRTDTHGHARTRTYTRTHTQTRTDKHRNTRARTHKHANACCQHVADAQTHTDRNQKGTRAWGGGREGESTSSQRKFRGALQHTRVTVDSAQTDLVEKFDQTVVEGDCLCGIIPFAVLVGTKAVTHGRGCCTCVVCQTHGLHIRLRLKALPAAGNTSAKERVGRLTWHERIPYRGMYPVPLPSMKSMLAILLQEYGFS